MDARHVELGNLDAARRALATLAPEAPALSREDAMRLLARLQAAEQHIVELERELHARAVKRHPSSR